MPGEQGVTNYRRFGVGAPAVFVFFGNLDPDHLPATCSQHIGCAAQAGEMIGTEALPDQCDHGLPKFPYHTRTTSFCPNRTAV